MGDLLPSNLDDSSTWVVIPDTFEWKDLLEAALSLLQSLFSLFI